MLLWPEKSCASFYWPLAAAAAAPPIMLATSRQLAASFFTQLAGGDSYVAGLPERKCVGESQFFLRRFLTQRKLRERRSLRLTKRTEGSNSSHSAIQSDLQRNQAALLLEIARNLAH